MANNNMPAWLEQIPPVTRNLLIINVLIWIIEAVTGSFGERLESILGLHFWGSEKFNPIQIFSERLESILGLHFWGSEKFNPIQIITYLFLHDRHTIMHIGFNMFTLWMFGRILERVWGARRFLVFYFICGIGAALVQETVWQLTWRHEYIDGIAALNHLTPAEMAEKVSQHAEYFATGMNQMKNAMLAVGASGAIFGLLLGFAFVFPDMPMYLFFIPVPIKAKYMVVGYGVLELFFGISGRMDSVAHFAHLGGLLFALIVLLWWRHKGTLRGGNFYY